MSMQDLKSKVQEGGTAVGQWRPEAREVLLRYLVHTADITNPIRPRPLSQEWSRRIMQEFYAQVRLPRAEPEHGILLGTSQLMLTSC